MGIEWFYQVGGEAHGPVSARELRALAGAGTVTADTLVRAGADGKWVTAKKVQGLWEPVGTASPPLPPVPAKKPPPLPPPVCSPVDGSPASVDAGVSARHRWRMSPMRWLLVATCAAALLVVLAVLVSLFGGGDSGGEDTQRLVVQKESDAEGEAVESGPRIGLSRPEENLSAVELYRRVSPAVVVLTAKDDLGRPVGRGSAFFVPTVPDGMEVRAYQSAVDHFWAGSQYANLVTNYHVVEAAVSCNIKLADGGDGDVFGVLAEDEKADLAILNVAVHSGQPVRTLTLHEGADTSVGESVYAMGNPEGLTNTLSEGIISGRREMVSGVPWLQTTAAISPGSSGGPLLTHDGTVIGVVTASRVEGQNVNFAVPVSAVRGLLEGPPKPREIWRGTSVSTEEYTAYQGIIDSAPMRQLKGGELMPEELVQLYQSKKLIMDGRCEQAIEGLSRVSPSFPKEWEYLRLSTLGKAHLHLLRQGVRTGGYGTVAQYREAVRLSPHFSGAVEALKGSIKLDSQFSPAYAKLCECHQLAGEWPEALLAAESLVKLVPRCCDAYRYRGQCFYELKRYEPALKDLRAAVELNPNDETAHYVQGDTYMELREYAHAVKAYEKAIQAGHPAAACYFGIGEAYEKQAEYAKAISAFHKAEALGFPRESCEFAVARCTARMQE